MKSRQKKKGEAAPVVASQAVSGPSWPFWAALALAALLPLLLFWRTTGFGLMLDDVVLFEKSPSLSDLGSIADGFTKDVGALRKGAETVNSSYYRPVFLAISTLYHQAVGGSAADWHRLCVLLAAAIGALVCWLFLRLELPPWLALAASAVFALHPSHVSSVAWASGLQELLAAFFVLLALHGAWTVRSRAGSGAAFFLALLAYVLAILSKEVALGFLPFLGLWALADRRTDPPAARRLGRLTAAAGALTLLYLGARLAVLGGRLALPAVGAPSFFASLAAVPVAVVTYLRLLLWPFSFAIFRPERPFYSFLSPAVLISLVVLAALAAAAFAAIRRRRELALPLAFFVCLLLPVLNLWVLDPQWMVTDRYLFLPSLALPWLLVLVLPRRVALGVLAGLAALFAVASFRYSAIFADERTFVAAMAEAEPTSPLIFTERGRLLALDGDAAGARAAYAKAAELDPKAPEPLERLGDYALQSGDLAAAEAFYRRALEVRPYASRGFKLLMMAQARAGREAEARRLADEAARLFPDDFQVRLLQAAFLLRAGRRPEAQEAYEAARQLRPGDPAVDGGFEIAMGRLLPSLGR